MMEFYFPKLKKKVMAEPVSGKAYRARGGSVRYGLQAMHDGAKSLPKYVSREEYGRLGFSAEQADAELPAYVPKVAYAEEAPVPASPLENEPSASPEPAEPTNENFSAEEIAYPVSWEGKDDNDGFIYGIEYLDDDGEVADVEWFSSVSNRDFSLAQYLEKYGAEIEGVVDYTRREEKNITVDQTVQQDYTVDTDPEDIPEDKMDEVEQAIYEEIDGVVSSDPASHDNALNDISVDTSVEVPDEDGDMVEVSAYGYTDEPMITDEENIRETTKYVSYYSESENPVHQFKGESSTCCDAETYRYKSEGDWLCMACDEFQAEFSPEELAKSSAIHGDFDHASINYSGHQNLLARAETRLNEDTYETTCDCGTVLKWMPLASATEKDGTRKMQKDMTVEQLEFPTPMFDHFEEEITMECPTCGEYHTCYIEAPVYNDRLKVDFGAETQEFTFAYAVHDKNTGEEIDDGEVTVTASNEREARGEAMRMLEEGGLDDEEFHLHAESLVEEPDFIPEGDGRALGQQNSSVNLSPLHAESYESEGMSRNAKMALGFTAIGLGIAAWKGKELVSLFDSLKEQIKKMTDK